MAYNQATNQVLAVSSSGRVGLYLVGPNTLIPRGEGQEVTYWLAVKSGHIQSRPQT